jgi:hypothetical protein
VTVKRRRYGKSGFGYKVDGERVPGVTRILGMLPKDNLIEWAANETARYGINNWAELSKLPPADRFDALAAGRWEKTRAGGQRGTVVHQLAADLADERLDWAAVPDEYRGYVEQYQAFRDTLGVDALEGGIELVVASREHRYCGTADLVADLGAVFVERELIPACRWLLEVKTSPKGPYPESALQAVAYANAEVFVHPDDPEDERPMDWLKIQRCGVVQLHSDAWALYPVDTGPEVWEAFLHLRWLYEADEDGTMKGWVGPTARPALLPAAT